jgi:hypothetical protein
MPKIYNMGPTDLRTSPPKESMVTIFWMAPIKTKNIVLLNRLKLWQLTHTHTNSECYKLTFPV